MWYNGSKHLELWNTMLKAANSPMLCPLCAGMDLIPTPKFPHFHKQLKKEQKATKKQKFSIIRRK